MENPTNSFSFSLSQFIVHWKQNTEYTYFCMSKNIISHTFLLVFKFAESFQCTLKVNWTLEQSLTSVLIVVLNNSKFIDYFLWHDRILQRFDLQNFSVPKVTWFLSDLEISATDLLLSLGILWDIFTLRI